MEGMNAENFFKELKSRFLALLEQEGILNEEIEIGTRSLSPEEAIGNTKRRDFPIIEGKDVMVQAKCMGSLGQAFTDAPTAFTGSLKEICELDLSSDSHNRGLFIAAVNAVMKHLGKVECTVHCRNEGPEKCSYDVVSYVKEHYGNPEIALIGYQPAMLQRLAENFKVRVVDLDEKNIAHERYGVMVEDGRKWEVTEEICNEADLILCTGSTVCNGTIVNFLKFEGKILFFGTTLAGAAALMNMPRLCFADRYQQ